MAELTNEEKELFIKVADKLTAKTPEQRKEDDKVVAMIVAHFHEVFKDVSDSDLARMANAIAYMLATFGGMTICELHSSIERMFTTYSLASAALSGFYNVLPEATSDAERIAQMAREKMGNETHVPADSAETLPPGMWL